MLAGDPRAIARAISLIEDESPPGAALLVGDLFPQHRPRVPHRRHRPARRRQEHAGRSADRGHPRSRATPSASSPSIRRARSPAARSSATACACRRTPATPACSSAAWRRAAISAAWRATTAEAALVLDAAGKDVVIIETVGVGQDEVDIVRTADVSIVTLVPGAGDEVQALKAGIMEIADIFVVNKADREGADRTVASIEAMLSLRAFGRRTTWRPPVVQDRGDDRRRASPSWWQTIERFRAHTAAAQRRAAPRARRVAAARAAGAALHAARRARTCWRRASSSGCWIASPTREIDPYTAVDGVMARALSGRRSRRAACDARSRRHRRRRRRRRRSRSIATRSAWRSTRRRTSASQRVRAHFDAGGRSRARAARGDAPTTRRSRSSWRSAAPGCITSRFASPTSRAALARAEGARRAADRRDAAAGRARLADRVHPPVERARRARSSLKQPRQGPDAR